MPRPATDTWRVFIAIEMPSEVRARLAEHSKSLRQMNPDVRASWARQENLHLTVKFLGEIPIARMEALSLAAEAATRGIDQFDLIVGSCGAFPGHGQPRVLWIGRRDQGTVRRDAQSTRHEGRCRGQVTQPRRRAIHLARPIEDDP